MKLNQKAIFSPDGEYFAFCNKKGLLRIWETSSNKLKQEHELNSPIKSITALTWGPSKHETSSSKGDEAVNNDTQSLDNECLIIGTSEGGLLSYDASSQVLSNNFVTAHTDTVTDLCWHSETHSLFSCSEDGSIAVWDYEKGRVKSNWEADNEPIYAICVIDSESLLSASTSISWWNIKNQTVIKKFSGHDTGIVHLLSVIATDALSNSYFLSAAAQDVKINAWNLRVKNSKNAVASFDLPDELESIDVTKYFSKNKPMYLSAVMKGGSMLIFKHILNGKTRKNLAPQMTLHVVTSGSPKPTTIPVIASKFTSDSESCVIAYGSIGRPTFEKVKILDSPKILTLSRDKPLLCQDSSTETIKEVKMYNKLGQFISANGKIPSLTPVPSSPKRRKQKDPDINTACGEDSTCIETQSSDHRASSNPSPNKKKKQRKVDKQMPLSADKATFDDTLSDPTKAAELFLNGLHTEDRALLNMVLECSDEELIRQSVHRIPLHNLRFILLELHKRISVPEERHSSSSRKWLKEILSVHLQNIIKDEDLRDTINLFKDNIGRLRVDETLSKMSLLRGLLNIQRIQNASSDTSDNETEENMET